MYKLEKSLTINVFNLLYLNPDAINGRLIGYINKLDNGYYEAVYLKTCFKDICESKIEAKKFIINQFEMRD